MQMVRRLQIGSRGLIHGPIRPRLLFCIASALVMLLPGHAEAQTAIPPMMPPATRDDASHPQLLQVSADGGYTGGSEGEFLGRRTGAAAAASATVAAFAALPVNEEWIIPLGVISQSVRLDTVPRAPVPDRIQTLSFSAGIGHRLGDDWMIMGMLNPELYKVSGMREDDIGLSGGINAIWRYSESLTVMFGLMVAPDSDLVVLPMVGADWRIDAQWELQLMFPQPRLVFEPDDRWSFHVGASLLGATFRSSDTLGSSIGQPQYNDALATYRDVRAGLGVGYRVSKSIRAELEGGYSVDRRIEYKHFGTEKFDSAPYVRLGVNLAF